MQFGFLEVMAFDFLALGCGANASGVGLILKSACQIGQSAGDLFSDACPVRIGAGQA
jgi:hypothetical protein